MGTQSDRTGKINSQSAALPKGRNERRARPSRDLRPQEASTKSSLDPGSAQALTSNGRLALFPPLTPAEGRSGGNFCSHLRRTEQNSTNWTSGCGATSLKQRVGIRLKCTTKLRFIS